MPTLLARLARLARARPRPVPPETKRSAAAPLIALQYQRQPVWSPRDYGTFAREGFAQNPVVYRCIRMIAEAAAAVPLDLFAGDTEITDHPLLDLLRAPNPTQTKPDLLEAWYGFLLVAGNAYIEAVGVGQDVRELYVLRPDRMTIVPGADGWPLSYDYTVNAHTVSFSGEAVSGVRKIMHLGLFHPSNDYYGLSPIEAAATAIDIHNAASAWNKAMLDNSALPSGALVYNAGDRQLTSEQYERLKSELEAGFQGARNAGRPMLLEGGLDWRAMSMTPKDMDFIESKRQAARDIALALGVPPMLLGIPGDNTHANYAEANRSFWRHTVLPLAGRSAKALASWLGPAFGGGLELRPDLDAIEALSSERDDLWKRVGGATFLTDAEKRAAVGYGDVAEDAGEAEGKFNPAQPRVPKDTGPEGGRWSGGDAGGTTSNPFRIADKPAGNQGAEPVQSDSEPHWAEYQRTGKEPNLGNYSPDRPGWHDYKVGPTEVCTSQVPCTATEMADQLSRYAYPGQDPAQPVVNGGTYTVYDPRVGIAAGPVKVWVSPDGMTIINKTLMGHVFFDGQILRHASQAPNGAWFIETHGIGNNKNADLAFANRAQGPQIFRLMDQHLRMNIDQHHGTSKSMASLAGNDLDGILSTDRWRVDLGAPQSDPQPEGKSTA